MQLGAQLRAQLFIKRINQSFRSPTRRDPSAGTSPAVSPDGLRQV
jgi:hypothetical protein